jgi:hypothetical protein
MADNPVEKKTHHFEIRYCFIHNHIKRGNVRVEYCPTDLMVGDFHTKPLQGSAFCHYRALILNLPYDAVLDPMTESSYELEDLSKPLDQDQDWITVKPSKNRKPRKVTFL